VLWSFDQGAAAFAAATALFATVTGRTGITTTSGSAAIGPRTPARAAVGSTPAAPGSSAAARAAGAG
jgi:hypothetical protein